MVTQFSLDPVPRITLRCSVAAVRCSRFIEMPTQPRDPCVPRAGTIDRFHQVTGADAALLLLEDMKMGAYGEAVAPDVFTYTTVIMGIARAAVRSQKRKMLLFGFFVIPVVSPC